MQYDATNNLIQRILSQLDSTTAQNIRNNFRLLSGSDSILGQAANYAQILGTAEGPIAHSAAIVAAGGAKAATENAAGQAVALTATAEAAGIGAGIVIILSFVLADLAGSSGSSDSEEIQQIGRDVVDIKNTDILDYWQNHLGPIGTEWVNGVGSDRDDLAAEGTIGRNVKNNVNGFHDHAKNFVNFLVPSKSAGTAQIYWQRPFLPSEAFDVGPVPYPVYGSWDNLMAKGVVVSFPPA